MRPFTGFQANPCVWTLPIGNDDQVPLIRLQRQRHASGTIPLAHGWQAIRFAKSRLINARDPVCTRPRQSGFRPSSLTFLHGSPGHHARAPLSATSFSITKPPLCRRDCPSFFGLSCLSLLRPGRFAVGPCQGFRTDDREFTDPARVVLTYATFEISMSRSISEKSIRDHGHLVDLPELHIRHRKPLTVMGASRFPARAVHPQSAFIPADTLSPWNRADANGRCRYLAIPDAAVATGSCALLGGRSRRLCGSTAQRFGP